MTGYVRKLECNSIMSFKISNKQLLKKYNQIWKSVEKLLKIEFDGKPVYGDDDKYIITKIKIYGGGVNTNFHDKTKSTMQLFINNNARFCYQGKEKVLFSNALGRMQTWTKMDKNWKSYW